MAINLAEKYSAKVVEKFYTESVVLGKTSKEYDWDGVKTINVYTITTVAPGAYTRSGTNRYGTPTEVQDTYQPLTITQDRAIALTIDKGNNTEQMLIKNAGKVMSAEMREQFIPEFDKYALAQWVANAGTKTVHASLAKNTIVEAISDHITALVNAGTNPNDAYCYIGATNFAKLLLSPEFLSIDKLGERNLERGVMGKVRGLQIVEVPDSYLGSGVNFLTAKKSCVLAPSKIKDMKIHQDPPGINGALLEVRWIYDAFVLDTKNKGVIVDKTA